MAKRLAGLHPLAYMGVNPSTPPQMIHRTHAPTANNDENVNIGAIWVVTDTDDIYMLTSLAGGVATWTPMSGLTIAGGTGITVTTVGNTSTLSVGGGTDGQVLIGSTGNDAAWANLESSGGTISIANTPGGINLEATGVAGLTQLDGDSGSATPIAGVIIIAGGSNITTSGAGQTLTIDLDDPLVVNALTISGLSTGVLVADAGGVVSSINGTDGQVIIGATGTDPVWGSVTSSNDSIIISEGASTLDLRSASGAGSPYIIYLDDSSFFASGGFGQAALSYKAPYYLITSSSAVLTKRVYSSTDLLSWNLELSVNTGSPIPFNGLHCGSDGYCVTGGGSAHTWVATDPTGTWTQYAFPNLNITNIDYGGGNWVVICHNIGTAAPEIATTADPTTSYTVNSTIFPEELLDTSYGNSIWVVVGENGYVATTPDPTSTWTVRTYPFSGNINSVVYSSDLSLFCAVGDGGRIATSPDGITWTGRPNVFTPATDITNVLWHSSKGLFIAFAWATTGLSYNGVIWFKDYKPFANTYAIASVAVGDDITAIGENVIGGLLSTIELY